MEVPVELIHPSPYQPRLTFNTEEIKDEIERDGLLSALVVRKHDDHYELLDGERRLRALKEMGWKIVPVDVRDVDDRTAMRSVFKINIIRENYTTEEKAKYFKRLADEGMKPYQIGQELNVDDQWVRAHLNIFQFPEYIQETVWADQLSVSTIREMEPVIGANIEEATAIAREAVARKLTSKQTRDLLKPRIEEIDRARVEAARQALEADAQEIGATAPISLETPEDYDRAAAALREEAKKRKLEALTPEERTALVAGKQRREEERAEKKRQAQRRREEEVRRRLLRDKEFLRQAARLAPVEEELIVGERPPVEQGGLFTTGFEVEFKPRVYNVWNFSMCDDRFGMKSYPGRIPGQIVQNLLYYYTGENDLVVDPMAGSGTTIDVCKLMNRRHLAYDLAPARDDIIQRDIRSGFPKEAENCQLIFLDPPYWRLQKEAYDELSSGQSTSALSYEEWLRWMKGLAKECFRVVRRKGVVTLLIQPFLDERVTGKFLDFPFTCSQFFLEEGFTEIQRISVPMPSEIKSAQDVLYAKGKRIMLDLNRDLIVFTKGG
jgi:ParB family chromosome partitioning protein